MTQPEILRDEDLDLSGSHGHHSTTGMCSIGGMKVQCPPAPIAAMAEPADAAYDFTMVTRTAEVASKD